MRGGAAVLKRKRSRLLAALLLGVALVCAAVAYGSVSSKGSLRVTVIGQLKPYKLPRNGTAPIAVFLSGHVSSASKAVPPQLAKLTIKLNKHGKLEADGLPACRLTALQPASTERALQNCGDAEVGSGRFWATVVLPGQKPYPTRGRLLIFNGKEGGRQVLFAHIYTERPFATSFVITFSLKHIDEGPYGTELSASLPGALGTWGYVDRIKLTLKRYYHSHGERRSYFNAGCPAPKGFKSAVFPLARVRFKFSGGQELSTNLTKSCGVKE